MWPKTKEVLLFVAKYVTPYLLVLVMFLWCLTLRARIAGLERENYAMFNEVQHLYFDLKAQDIVLGEMYADVNTMLDAVERMARKALK
jgi:hypothetical protein